MMATENSHERNTIPTSDSMQLSSTPSLSPPPTSGTPSPTSETTTTPSGENAPKPFLSPTMSKIFENSATWLVLWFSLNMGVTLTNKALFHFSNFSFPITVSLIHMLFTAGCSTFVMNKFPVPRRAITGKREMITIALMGLLFCSNIITGNVGLSMVSVSLVQCVRSTIPGITMGLSILILGKSYGWKHYVTVLMVIIGVGTASISEINFKLLGFMFVVIVCFLSSLKSVMTNKFLVQKGMRFHPFDLLHRMSWLSVGYLAILWIATLEPVGLYTWWIAEGNGTIKLCFSLALNGFMAFFLNVANFFFTKHTSALTVTIAGNVKHVATICVSIAIFKNPVSGLNALGIVITSLGAALYSLIEYREAIAAAKAKAAAKSPV